MRTYFRSFIFTSAFLLYAISAYAQPAPALSELVQELYLKPLTDDQLHKLKISDLDAYSHFLSQSELNDIRALPKFQSYLQRINPDALYLRIPVFHADTAEQVHQALLARNCCEKIQFLIIDLRGNRGGLLNSAIEVADEFIETGVIAETTGRADSTNMLFTASANTFVQPRTIAILMDKQSASAAELLAGVLRINASAILFGQSSFGKSTVQSQIALEDGKQMRLTTAIYQFSNKTHTPKQGLKPDYRIAKRRLQQAPAMNFQAGMQDTEYKNPLIHEILIILQKANKKPR